MEYQDLISKFLAGEISDEEMEMLKAWIKEEPGNRRIFDEENELWQKASEHLLVDSYNTDRSWLSISSRLGFREGRSRFSSTIRKNSYRLLLAAASVVLLLAIGSTMLLITLSGTLKKLNSSVTMVSTRQGDRAHIFLPDSTEVFLNSESDLKYRGDYNSDKREIQFNGEAYFNVRTDPSKPFEVNLKNGVKVTATGTRFNIYSFSNESRIEATLEKGIVTVSAEGLEPVMLQPGQQAVYLARDKRLLLRDVNVSIYTSWKENMLRFDDTPLEDVFRRIGRKYNVKFEISGVDMLDLKFTATFIDESLEDIMDMLKSVSPIDYKIYYRTSVHDKSYLKPRVVIFRKKTRI